MIGTSPKKELIKEWLKAGFIESGVHKPTERGTPQGGVISPLLANIGLHGLEQFIKQVNPKLGIIRYADDFTVTAKDKQSLEQVLTLIKQWLSSRGLEINTEKTRVVHIDDGFNLLGFNLRQYKGKLLTKP
jgi:RNA-directed DNA polymerase